MSDVKKTLVVAWDGATWELLAPWCDEGRLPNLARLRDGGAGGVLTTTYPPLTGPAWSSFMTGKSPGRHGVFEFFRRRPGDYSQTLNDSSSIQGKTLWGLLSEAGRKVGIMNVPLTYPPEKVNGFLLSGLLTPRDAADWAWPPALAGEIEKNVGPYLIHHDEKYSKGNVDTLLAEQNAILESRTEAALYLMETKEWDLFMVHFYGSDRITHEFWHLLDPAHPQHDRGEREKYGNVVLDFFEKLDRSLGRLLEKAGEETAVIVMSDHGMGQVSRFINVNTWLLREGFMVMKGDLATSLRYGMFRLGLNYYSAGRMILRLGLGKKAVQVGRGRRQELQEKLFCSFRDVDWGRTRAYSMGNYGQIYVNLKGREGRGIVNPGEEYEGVVADLSARLLALQDGKSGGPVVEEVFRRDDVYRGPRTDEAPDLMFRTRDMEYKALGLSDFSSPRVFDDVYGCTGNHRMNGILAMQGKGLFREGAVLSGAGIEDLAPTILHLLGVAVPDDMDGKVLVESFTEEFRSSRPTVFVEGDDSSSAPAGGYSKEEEEELARRLKDLGYA